MSSYMQGGGATFAVEVWRATRDNELVEDLTPYVQKGKVNYNADRRIRRAGSIEVRGPRLTPYVDYLAPFLRVTYDDGRPEVFSQRGLYTLRAPAGARNKNVMLQSFALNDLTYELDAANLSAAYTVPANALYTDHILALVEATGIARTNIPTRTARTTAVKTFPLGANRLDVINEGLQIVGCYAVSTDDEGLIESDVVRPLAEQEPVMLVTNLEVMGDVTSQPVDRDPVNVVILTVERTDQAPLISIARNDDPNSPTSTVSLGKEQVREEKITQIESQAALDALAAALLQEGRSFYETCKLRLKPNPNFGTHNVIDVAMLGELQYFNGRWAVRTWEQGLTIADPTITIECNRFTDDWKGVLI